jgi:acyl-coenzyme A thioesterase PaaI-like protein
MSTVVALHAFDEAMQLEPLAQGEFRARTSPLYMNMVGPFGGVTAAQMLSAALAHEERAGTPVTATVNFLAPLQAGEFRLRVRKTRQNRSSQHWYVELLQGDDEVRSNATVMTALRRQTWQATELPVPEALRLRPARLDRLDTDMEFINRYEFSFLEGPLFPEGDPPSYESSSTVVWVRDAPSRAVDFAGILAVSDTIFPRIYLRRPDRVPIGTVSLTTYFHCDQSDLDQVGSQPMLGVARGQVFSRNFFDQSSQLWSPEGRCLATSHQIVYFKS